MLSHQNHFSSSDHHSLTIGVKCNVIYPTAKYSGDSYLYNAHPPFGLSGELFKKQRHFDKN